MADIMQIFPSNSGGSLARRAVWKIKTIRGYETGYHLSGDEDPYWSAIPPLGGTFVTAVPALRLTGSSESFGGKKA
ncbi:hypothetical protein J2S43_003754 [Catenuloplanes nepalensis]|uniref:Uncharacterized protein n=1 Tax=Catenuloplanes nepalensis TaxID=587533 RepID=A0ABT9MUX8_9ACTN|nr:hypothetical protein [Catenuloplanes nepalensis]MDP9795242.1 hypothetical protein [Catenuloplanes nepalensis]